MPSLVVLSLLVAAGCLLVYGLLRRQFRSLQAEVGHLPPAPGDWGLGHPLVGVSIRHLVTMPKELVGRPVLVLIAAPGCGSCRGAVERLIQAREQQELPAICLIMPKDDPQKIQAYFTTFQSKLPLQMAPDELIKRLNITTFPFSFIVDGTGVIRRVGEAAHQLVGKYRAEWQSNQQSKQPGKQQSKPQGGRLSLGLILGRAFRLVWQHGKGWMLFSLLASVVMGTLPIATLTVTKHLIDTVTELVMKRSEDFRMALWLLLAQFLIVLLSSTVQKAQEYFNRKLEFRLDHLLQQQILHKTSSVPYSYYDLPEFQDHLDRVNGGMGGRFLQPLKNVLEIGKSALVMLSFLGFLFTVHWSLVVISTVASIPIFFIQSGFGKRSFQLTVAQTKTMREAHYLSHLLKSRPAAGEVRLFRLAAHLTQLWSQKFLKNAAEQLSLQKKQQTAYVGLDGITALFYTLAAGVMVWLMRTSTVTVGDFVAIGQAVQGTQGSINGISQQLARLYESGLFIRDYFSLLEYEAPHVRKTEGTEPFPALVQGISVENISYRYVKSQRDVLQDVSFRIRPGEKVALVGENGSGKTTLVKCLMGLYPVTGGQICFDGVNLDAIEQGALRKEINVIFQDFMRYQLPVRDNIACSEIEQYGDDVRLAEAAEKSGAAKFVGRMAQGYDTYLGRMYREGEDLSGGQWQKIALARAVFADAQVVILDEPTAALDPQAERDVFAQFERLTAGKTAIFISHRMAAARLADRIVVMKDGRVAEQGTHAELMALGGEYRRMYEMQAEWYGVETGGVV